MNPVNFILWRLKKGWSFTPSISVGLWISALLWLMTSDTSCTLVLIIGMFFQGTMKVANQELFNINGLSKYTWLVYSEDKSGGFCLPCVLFAKHSCDLGQLVMHILSTFTSASNRLREHETKALIDAESFLRFYDQRQSTVGVHSQLKKIEKFLHHWLR